MFKIDGCVKQQNVGYDVTDARPSEDLLCFVKIPVTDRINHDEVQDITTFVYNMNHKHRGVAIIFNHNVYTNKSLPKRIGTEKDVEALQKCLPLLGFEPDNIIVENDLTKGYILNYSYRILAAKNEIFADCDCIAVFILTHGSKGNMIYARDGDYDLYHLIEQFTPNNFPELADKPKLFFINACRGNNSDVGRHNRYMNGTVNDSIDTIKDDSHVYSLPVHSDILISMNSHFERASFRNVDGSWYIQDFCNVINRLKAHNKLNSVEISELLMYTNYLVSQRGPVPQGDKKQISMFISALTRKLYFKTKN